MLSVYAVINYTNIYDVITDVCLHFYAKLEVISFKTKVLTLKD